MAETTLGWESMVKTMGPPDGTRVATGTLLAALLTTYDKPDARLLAEELLPIALRLNRDPKAEDGERPYFLMELQQRLNALRNKIIIVSSKTRDEPREDDEEVSGEYEWLWKFVHRHTVGVAGRPVQHAKLWMLHWRGAQSESGTPNGAAKEYLEIVISSANLTQSAFRGQIQAGWKVCIPLEKSGSQARRKTWGVLPAFLDELATSSGGKDRLQPFVELLGRAECPPGTRFVASVPGNHSKEVLQKTPWGARGLRGITPEGRGKVRLGGLSPFIGTWNAESIVGWCKEMGSLPGDIRLVWIDTKHPWAIGNKWVMPKETLKGLRKAGVMICRLPDHTVHGASRCGDEDSGLFHDEHAPSDERWSHAKVYWIKRGNSERLLITSANFSKAAWGSQMQGGGRRIENFELGVCVDGGKWPFNGLSSFAKHAKNVFTCEQEQHREAGNITWAEAGWDGKVVCVRCRCVKGHALEGQLECGGEPNSRDGLVTITGWKSQTNGDLRVAKVKWVDAKRMPVKVVLRCEGEVVDVAVLDERKSRRACDAAVPFGVDPNEAERIRDKLLFEQYGGPVACGDEPIKEGGAMEKRAEGVGNGQTESYEVPVMVRAREYLEIVDNWVKSSQPRSGGEADGEILADGERLEEAFVRQADRDRETGGAMVAIGARMAAEEIGLRLKHFRKERK